MIEKLYVGINSNRIEGKVFRIEICKKTKNRCIEMKRMSKKLQQNV